MIDLIQASGELQIPDGFSVGRLREAEGERERGREGG
jgi:hypothetical protein